MALIGIGHRQNVQHGNNPSNGSIAKMQTKQYERQPQPRSRPRRCKHQLSSASHWHIGYLVNIYLLLWTNCVIFTESAQHKLAINPISNLLHQYQRIESNTTPKSNSISNLTSEFNLDEYTENRKQSYMFNISGRNYDDGNNNNNNAETENNAITSSSNSRNCSRTSNMNNNSNNTEQSNHNSYNNGTSIKSNGNHIASEANRELDSSALQKFSSKSDMPKTMAKSEQVPSAPTAICLRPHFIGNESSPPNQWFHNKIHWHRTRHKSTSNDRLAAVASCIVHNKRSIHANGNDVTAIKRPPRRTANVIDSMNRHAIKRDVNNFTAHILDGIYSYLFRRNKNNNDNNANHNRNRGTIMSTDSIRANVVSATVAMSNGILPTTMIAPIERAHHSTAVVNIDSKRKADRAYDSETPINRTKSNRNNDTNINSNITTGLIVSRLKVSSVFEMDAKRRQYDGRKIDSTVSNTVNGSAVHVNETIMTNNGRQRVQQHEQQRNGLVTVLGLFEMSTRNGARPEGHTELLAAQLAIRHINEQALLPGYTLQLITNDTKCDPGIGVDRFFHALYTKYTTRIVMLLGSACSEVTESLAKVVPYWNILQVSFGSTSPALSDRNEFPLFYRTVAPDSSHNPARIAFIRRFGWDTVTTFSQNEEIHSLAVNDLVTELENANISCAATITFGETDFKNQLLMLRDLDTRIIIGSFSHELAPKIFCEAFKLGMYGADYVWILHEIAGTPWWYESTPECDQKQLQVVAENVIVVSSYNSIVNDDISHSGLSYSMFVHELSGLLQVPQSLSKYAAQTYDAMWAIALTLRGAELKWQNDTTSQFRLDEFDYTRYDMAVEFLHQFSQMNFLGVSGPVSFNGADRIGISVFSQVQKGILNSVALYYPSQLLLDFNCPKCVPVKWKGNQVPIAKRIFKLRVATIAPIAFFIISALSLVGIILSIAFLIFNLHYRKMKAIKLSSPKLTNITAFGCILVYAAVILLGLDYSTLPAHEKAFPVVCTARVYLLSSGFSLAFGSMFAKTYRVHRIFTRSGSSVCKDKMLRDTQLISLVLALLLLDGLVVVTWVIADPMERHLNNLTLEISLTDRSVVYQPQVEVCRSQHTQTWLGVLYAYKGLLLVVGVYMAYETRHVKIAQLNDSQYIGLSVYSVVITSSIVVVLANLIAERVTLAFITITALIITSTTSTLCLLFVPKMHDIWGKGGINDPVIHSMGLKMECNTRRFMIDDKRELQYRVEVQNRVYKKELAALDIEIGKLEKMLESPSSTSSSDLSIPRLIRHEFAIVNEESEKAAANPHRTTSIGGGLPLLLLSVLPPVIPRASWPSTSNDPNTSIRKSVTFSSEPHLENDSSVARLPAIDLLHLRLTHQQAAADAHKGFIDRIIGFFDRSKPSSRKASMSSITGGSSNIAAAFRAHMGLLSNLVPTASSCTAIDTADSQPLRKMSITKSGNAIDGIGAAGLHGFSLRERNRPIPAPPPFIISTDVDNEITVEPNKIKQRNIYVDTEHESKVNFQLPMNRRQSIQQQPTMRDRIRGSPRFPHRIAPTSSLNALVETGESAGSPAKIKWKSMEDSTVFASTNTAANSRNTASQ